MAYPITTLRVGAEQREELERGAALLGQPWTSAMRAAGLERAREVIAARAIARAEEDTPDLEPAEREGEE